MASYFLTYQEDSTAQTIIWQATQTQPLPCDSVRQRHSSKATSNNQSLRLEGTSEDCLYPASLPNARSTRAD